MLKERASEEIRQKVKDYFASQGIIDKTGMDLLKEVRIRGGTKFLKETMALTTQDSDGLKGQMRFYDALARDIHGISIYDFGKSQHYGLNIWRLSEVYHHLKEFSPTSVIDIGCASGLETCFIAKELPDARVVGIDISPKMIDNAKSRAKKMNLENALFIVGDRDHMPFENGSFEAATYLNSFKEGTEEDRMNFNCLYDYALSQRMQEVKRVLAPNGLLIMMIPSTPELDSMLALQDGSRVESAGFRMLDIYESRFPNDHSGIAIVADKI